MTSFVSGELGYFSNDGARRGREAFWIKRGPSGLTMTADVSIDDRAVERSVTYSVAPDFTPRRCYVTVRDAERDHGAAIFDFDDAGATLVSLSVGGVSHTHVPVTDLPYFGAHPIVMDGWIPVRALHRLGAPEGVLDLAGGYTSSVKLDGASGPGLNAVSVWGKALGVEQVGCPAGRFACHRIELTFGDEFADPHPPYTVWITTGPEHVLVRAEVPGFARYYELTQVSGL